MTAQEGATPEPEGKNECMGIYRHKWEWVWEGKVWTDKLRCANCNEVKESSSPDQISRGVTN